MTRRATRFLSICATSVPLFWCSSCGDGDSGGDTLRDLAAEHRFSIGSAAHDEFLFDDDYQPKPAYFAIADALRQRGSAR